MISVLRFLPWRSWYWALIDGDHRQSEVGKIWNFSRLRILCLEFIILDFLTYAPLEQLAQLKSLRLRELGFMYSLNWNPELFRSLLGKVLRQLKDLSKLKIEDEKWPLLVPRVAVIGLGSRLQKLRLGDSFRGAIEKSVVQVSELSQLQEACPNLTSLSLNFSMSNPEVRSAAHYAVQFNTITVGAFFVSQDID
jgi:hypothetical protein